MKTDLFDYPLPRELIAQEPLGMRDSSRLMHVERSTGEITHHVFSDLPGLLCRGDCLVVNSSRVFPGRLQAMKDPTGGAVELLLLEKTGEGTWNALTRGATIRPGSRLSFPGSAVKAEVLDGPVEGRALIGFLRNAEIHDSRPDPEEVFALGRVPLPPYITGDIPDTERYQTVYSEREISAAAPTAGLHFTGRLLHELGTAGMEVATLELAVGMDTFIPVREEEVEDHRIHSEWFSVGAECARTVNGARRLGGRAVAVGTTVVRALESAARANGTLGATEGSTTLFITPGYAFRAVDALITNFHFPRSTLLMLVCAFGGRELILEAYDTAVRERYRFYSFGDAMLVT
jgi:S-adenosylmethionine:tRNA ribosyltransferase-isomerase